MMYSKCNWLFPRIEMETTLHFWLRTYWVWFNGCKVLRGHALIDASMQTLQVVQLWLGMKAVTKCQKQSLIDTHLWERWCARRDWSKATEAIMLKPLKSAPKSLQRMIFKLQKYNLQMKYNKGRRYSWQTHSTMQKSTPVNLHKTWRMWITQVLCTQWRSIACSNSNMPQHFYKCYRNSSVWMAREKSDVPESIQPYFGQDELTPQDKFVFKSGHSFCDDDDGSGTC